MHFKIHIEFAKILIRFKQKNICWFIYEMLFEVICLTPSKINFCKL
jgi:hypothetical protein